MSDDHNNALFHSALGIVLAAISHLTITEVGQIVVMVCAVGNLAMQYLRWKYPK